MAKDTKVTKFLRQCKEQIKDPARWTRGCEMRRYKGRELYCLLGAANVTAGGKPVSEGKGAYEVSLTGVTYDREIYRAALALLADAARELFPDLIEEGYSAVSVITSFNDHNHRKKVVRHSEVMAVADEAIKRSRR